MRSQEVERTAVTLMRTFIWRSTLFVSLAAIGIADPALARAADFNIVYKSCPGDPNIDGRAMSERENCNKLAAKVVAGRLVVGLSGPIVPDDTKRLRETIDRHVARVQAFGYDGTGTFVTVVMSGEGGDFDEAVRLGRFFKTAFVHTRIAKDTRCESACALAFMGGTALRGRLERPAIERRLEAGGALAFNSPFVLKRIGRAPAQNPEAAARDAAARLSAYAVETQIAPTLVTRMLRLHAAQRLPIDSVFWAKIAEVAVDGVRPPPHPNDDHYISACYAQADWNYGFRGDLGEPPRLRHDNGEWMDAEVLHRAEGVLIVSVVVSFGDYDFWCAVNTSKQQIRIARGQMKAILATERRRNTLPAKNFDEDIVLKPNELYFSRSPNDRSDRRPGHGLDLLLHPPTTKLSDIVDPSFERDFWKNPDE